MSCDPQETLVDPADSQERAETSCRYCFAPATDSVLIEKGDSLKFDIRADVCALHHGLLTREQPTSVDSLRRRHARDVPQLTIFDMPGLGPGDAIIGG